jgi:hypothetical protein
VTTLQHLSSISCNVAGVDALAHLMGSLSLLFYLIVIFSWLAVILHIGGSWNYITRCLVYNWITGHWGSINMWACSSWLGVRCEADDLIM